MIAHEHHVHTHVFLQLQFRINSRLRDHSYCPPSVPSYAPCGGRVSLHFTLSFRMITKTCHREYARWAVAVCSVCRLYRTISQGGDTGVLCRVCESSASMYMHCKLATSEHERGRGRGAKQSAGRAVSRSRKVRGVDAYSSGARLNAEPSGHAGGCEWL